MKPKRANGPQGGYVLATGEAATHRLRVLHELYGPGARSVLLRAGRRRGMRVADLGCGVGMVTRLLAELVGADGQVVGVDASDEQIAQARLLLPPGCSNVSFAKASATDTGLPPETFDLVYCRFLLIHLTEPDLALRELPRLLNQNGVVVVTAADIPPDGHHAPCVLTCLYSSWR